MKGDLMDMCVYIIVNSYILIKWILPNISLKDKELQRSYNWTTGSLKCK